MYVYTNVCIYPWAFRLKEQNVRTHHSRAMMYHLSVANSGVVYELHWESNGNQLLYVVGCENSGEKIFHMAASFMQQTLHEAGCSGREKYLSADLNKPREADLLELVKLICKRNIFNGYWIVQAPRQVVPPQILPPVFRSALLHTIIG